ncbi:cytochrome P450 [Streptomyces tricolor]|nr:cytochrome P450 [Streptomyces tricolor]
MRYDGGSVESATFRYATEGVEYSGTLIPKGALVQIAISSANRDPQKFGSPTELDVMRPGNALGRPSRLRARQPLLPGRAASPAGDTQLALTRLFDRFPRMALADPAAGPRWLEGALPGLPRPRGAAGRARSRGVSGSAPRRPAGVPGRTARSRYGNRRPWAAVGPG